MYIVEQINKIANIASPSDPNVLFLFNFIPLIMTIYIRWLNWFLNCFLHLIDREKLNKQSNNKRKGEHGLLYIHLKMGLTCRININWKVSAFNYVGCAFLMFPVQWHGQKRRRLCLNSLEVWMYFNFFLLSFNVKLSLTHCIQLRFF